MRKYAPIYKIISMSTTLLLEVADQKIFTSQFYHLNMENPICHHNFILLTPLRGRGRGQVGVLTVVMLESPYPLCY